MTAASLLRWTNVMWSKFRAQLSGIPSVIESRTSVASPRIVRVAGTTMISLSVSMTLVGVSSSTGRRLSGAANVYQRISPRRTGRLSTLCLPRRTFVVLREFVGAHRRPSICLGITRRVAGRSQDGLRQPYLLVMRELRDQRQQVVRG
jgi:hypothetical protein